MAHELDFEVLGPLRVVVDGAEVPIPTRRQRALLVLLLLEVGRAVPAERLVDQLWDGEPPPQGAVTLRSYVSTVRQVLGGPEGAGGRLVTRGKGYCLEVPPQSVDAVRLTTGAREGRAQLRQGRPELALAAFDAALGTWTGDPLADIADHEAARSTITALHEAHAGAVEGRLEALLALGRHADALPDLEAFSAQEPLREGPRALLMLALHRSGRTAEALEVHRSFRTLLGEELGLDPSPALDALRQRILEQDPTLAAPFAPVHSEAHRDPDPTSPVRNQVVVGRDRELALMSRLLDDLTGTGAGSLLVVSGEPGIGKTTVVEVLEHRARGRGVPVHAARSPSASGAPAFWLWSQVVESVAAALDDDALARACAGTARPVAQISPTVAERTGQRLSLPGDDPQALRFLLYEAVSAFLQQATDGAPVVVTLDDVQWADAPSLELIAHLAPGLAGRPVLLVAAYRDLAVERSAALEATLAVVSREDAAYELALTGLDPAAVADLVDTLVDGPLDGDLSRPVAADRARRAAVVHERTAGNPFFVRQLTRLMLEQDAGDGADPLSGPAPPGVRHVVARRLAALSDPARQLLDAAAVVGREFDLRTAAAVAELDVADALDACDETSAHGLVDGPEVAHGRARDPAEPTTSRRFVHALVQEVVLEGLPAGRAARLHARVAERLAREGAARPDELARHLWAARDLVGAAAVPALVAAADAASRVYAVDEAETQLRRAVQLVRQDPDADQALELDLLLRLFPLIVSGRGWGDAAVRGIVDRAMELAKAGAYTDATVRLWWSLFFFLLDRDDKSYVEVADTLLRTLDHDGTAARSRPLNHASRAVVHLFGIYSALDRDERDVARAHLDAARRHVEAARPTDLGAFDEHLHVMLLLIEGFWAALTGDVATYRSTTDAAVALADADGRPFPRAVARTLALSSGPYVEDAAFVHDLAAEALDLDRRFRFGWLESIAGCMDAWSRACLGGSTPDAVAHLEAQLADVVAAARHGNEGVLLLPLADVYALEGRRDRAREALERVRTRPGPYNRLVVDIVEERLRRLG